MSRADPPNSLTSVTSDERKRLLRLAYRFCWNDADAEDALQNALLNAFEKTDQLQDQRKRWSWLCRIVVQHCHLLGRKRSQRRECELSERGKIRAGAHAAELDQTELGALMRRLLVELPEQQRTALTLRHIEQMDYPRIAQLMELSESTVRVHVRAGRETLRRLILARHPDWKP